MFSVLIASIVLALPILTPLIGPRVLAFLGRCLGIYLCNKTAGRRAQIIEVTQQDQAELVKNRANSRRKSDESWESVDHDVASSNRDESWDGIVGFFHPFCNAGGGGERVLWAAIRATQQRWPNAKCVVYTGDHDVDKTQILARVENRFNISLRPPTVTFLYLTTRQWVLASTWPRFTLIGQSLGSVVMAYDAFSLLVPDIFVDTMGYAFALGFSKLLFPNVPTGAYVHYPTISTDMLGSLDATSATGKQGVNAGKGAGVKGQAKKVYWELFAKLYSRVGSTIDIVMTNSSWTQGHIRSLWDDVRRISGKSSEIAVVWPPVAVEELEQEVQVSHASESKREKILLYIAQFRPEKNHQLVMNAFAQFMTTKSAASHGTKLVLVGSVRDDSDSKRVYELRLAANELKIKDDVEFHLDASWPEILDWLRRSSVGVNCMWNEHFGIGVVEYQAAGLISVVHDSGGPKNDIVTEVQGSPTGFHATTSEEFAAGFEKALSIKDTLPMRMRARLSAKRFTEAEFARKWLEQMEILVDMTK